MQDGGWVLEGEELVVYGAVEEFYEAGEVAGVAPDLEADFGGELEELRKGWRVGGRALQWVGFPHFVISDRQ